MNPVATIRALRPTSLTCSPLSSTNFGHAIQRLERIDLRLALDLARDGDTFLKGIKRQNGAMSGPASNLCVRAVVWRDRIGRTKGEQVSEVGRSARMVATGFISAAMPLDSLMKLAICRPDRASLCR